LQSGGETKGKERETPKKRGKGEGKDEAINRLDGSFKKGRYK